MLKISLLILVLSNICLINAMEAPEKLQIQDFSISGKQGGSIDDSYAVSAQLMKNTIPLVKFISGLQSCRSHSVGRLCYQGPGEKTVKCFIGSITSNFEYNRSSKNASSLLVLLAFAINNLKELHSKQQSCNEKNKELYINAFLKPQDEIRNICRSFGFRKVDNFRIWCSSLDIYDPKGLEDCYDVYLLDPSAQQQADDMVKRFLLPASAITIETEISEEKADAIVPSAAIAHTPTSSTATSVTNATQILSEVTSKIRKSPRRLVRKKYQS